GRVGAGGQGPAQGGGAGEHRPLPGGGEPAAVPAPPGPRTRGRHSAAPEGGAICSAKAYDDLEAVVAGATSGQPLLVVLDGVEDPANLGAVVRTAVAAGAHGVVIPERRAAGLSPAVARAAAGALEHMRIARVANL